MSARQRISVIMTYHKTGFCPGRLSGPCSHMHHRNTQPVGDKQLVLCTQKLTKVADHDKHTQADGLVHPHRQEEGL